MLPFWRCCNGIKCSGYLLLIERWGSYARKRLKKVKCFQTAWEILESNINTYPARSSFIMGETQKLWTFTGKSTPLCKTAIVIVLMRPWLGSAWCQESICTAACFFEISTKETERKVSKKVFTFTSVFLSFAKENSVLQNVSNLSERNVSLHPSPPHSAIIQCYRMAEIALEQLLVFPCHLVCAYSMSYSSWLIIQTILWPFENGNKVKIKKVKICIHTNITCTSGNGVARVSQQ